MWEEVDKQKPKRWNLAIVLLVIIAVSFFLRAPQYAPATREGGVISSQFLDLRFDLPEGWETLDSDYGLDLPMADPKPVMADGEPLNCEFFAVQTEAGMSAVLYSQKSRRTADDLLDAVEAQSGGTGVTLERLEARGIGGAVWEGLSAARAAGDGERVYLFARSTNGYLAVLALTGERDEALIALLDQFSPYKS